MSAIFEMPSTIANLVRGYLERNPPSPDAGHYKNTETGLVRLFATKPTRGKWRRIFPVWR